MRGAERRSNPEQKEIAAPWRARNDGLWLFKRDMDKQSYVYIMTNKNKTVLYTGVTTNLKKRVYEHKNKLVAGFTKKYNILNLLYYEVFEDPENAILREKQIKAGSRQKKIDLINGMNRE